MIKFSVIVPTYNRAELLVQCLESLAKQRVSKKEYEVIVVDDGSIDGTQHVVEGFRKRMHLRYIKHARNRGIPSARNSGIRHARGNYIAFAADDYELPGNYVQCIITLFAKHSDVHVIKFNLMCRKNASRYEQLQHRYWEYHILAAYHLALQQPELLRIKNTKKQHTHIKPFFSSRIEAGVCAFRKNIFTSVGYFREDLQRGEDAEFTIRLAHAGYPLFFYPYVHVKRRYSRSLFSSFLLAYRAGRWRYRIKLHHHRFPLLITSGLLKTLDRFLNVIVTPLRMAARESLFLPRIYVFLVILVIKVGGFLGEVEGLFQYIARRILRK